MSAALPPVQVTSSGDPPHGWEDLARRFGTFYHAPVWIEGLRSAFGFRVHYLASNDQGTLIGGLPLMEVPPLLGPRRLVSLPFSYATGVMAADIDVGADLMNAARALAARRGIRRVEIKQFRSDLAPFAGFARSTRYAAYRVATDGGPEAVWRRLHRSSTQRGISKGRQAGVTATLGSSREEWEAMARLQEMTSHRLGVPAPPRRFFVDVCRRLQSAGAADLYLAHLPNGELAAGITIWKGAREWIYAFGASRHDLLSYRPNHVALWAALERAAAEGVPFDLGRAAPEQHGLVEFKRRWGGEPVPLPYDYWPGAAGLNVRRRDTGALGTAARLWSRLPSGVARRGSFLYKYLG